LRELCRFARAKHRLVLPSFAIGASGIGCGRRPIPAKQAPSQRILESGSTQETALTAVHRR
jgi:hypothetical protein